MVPAVEDVVAKAAAARAEVAVGGAWEAEKRVQVGAKEGLAVMAVTVGRLAASEEKAGAATLEVWTAAAATGVELGAVWEAAVSAATGMAAVQGGEVEVGCTGLSLQQRVSCAREDSDPCRSNIR